MQESFDTFSAYFQGPTPHRFFEPWIQLLEGLEVGGKPQSWKIGESDDGGICAVDLVKCPTQIDWGSFVRQPANAADKKLVYPNCFEEAGPGRFLKRQISLHQPKVLVFADTASYLRRALEKIAPMNSDYAHNARWGDDNGYAHLRSALMGTAKSYPVEKGELGLGTWQQVVLCDFDECPRTREVMVTVCGE